MQRMWMAWNALWSATNTRKRIWYMHSKCVSDDSATGSQIFHLGFVYIEKINVGKRIQAIWLDRRMLPWSYIAMISGLYRHKKRYSENYNLVLSCWNITSLLYVFIACHHWIRAIWLQSQTASSKPLKYWVERRQQVSLIKEPPDRVTYFKQENKNKKNLSFPEQRRLCGLKSQEKMSLKRKVTLCLFESHLTGDEALLTSKYKYNKVIPAAAWPSESKL